MVVIKLLLAAMQTCRDLGVHFALVGNPQIITESKGFEETSSWAFLESMDAAKLKFATPAAA
jgi:two-component system cell cycle response regulator